MFPETYVNQCCFARDYDERPGLARVHIPTLIIQGKGDPLDLTLAAETRDAIPGAKLTVVEKAGHFGWLEQPNVYATTLRAFLKGK